MILQDNYAFVLSPIAAFYAMHIFVEGYFEITRSDSLGALLSCMHFLDDDQTADPALWEDWIEITNNRQLTIEQAFQSMDVFLRNYYQASTSINVKNMLHDISLVTENKIGKDHAWRKWEVAVDQVFSHQE